LLLTIDGLPCAGGDCCGLVPGIEAAERGGGGGMTLFGVALTLLTSLGFFWLSSVEVAVKGYR